MNVSTREMSTAKRAVQAAKKLPPLTAQQKAMTGILAKHKILPNLVQRAKNALKDKSFKTGPLPLHPKQPLAYDAVANTRLDDNSSVQDWLNSNAPEGWTLTLVPLDDGANTGVQIKRA